jgi:hypothetical protein
MLLAAWGLLVEHGDELRFDADASAAVFAGSLGQKVAAHGHPAHPQANRLLQTACDQQTHHGLAAAGWAFHQDRPQFFVEKQLHRAGDDALLVGSWFNPSGGDEVFDVHADLAVRKGGRMS